MSSGVIPYFSMHTALKILPFAFLTGIFDAGSCTIDSSLLQMSETNIRGRVFGIWSLVNRAGGCYFLQMIWAEQQACARAIAV